MLKAYDTMLQSEVSADLAAKSSSFEPYRYECACCGEEVYLAAAYSTSMVPHFRHRSGNNDVECENYLGQFGAISIDSRSRKSNRERVEFYFEKSNKTFSLGLRFSSEEINAYEQHNVVFELRSSAAEQAFFTLLINNTNFAPDAPTMIPIDRFAFSYFLSNTLNGTKRKYDFLKIGNAPTFFKLQGNDSDYKAKLVRGSVLYTNVPYFVACQSQYPTSHDACFPDEIRVDDTFCFETMGRKFLGKVLTINNKTAQIDALVLSWGYQLEASETLTLLWPPAALVDDVSTIHSDYAYLYSSFELQAHGNINVHSEDIYKITNGVSKVSITPKTKVFKKNAEIIIDKSGQYSSGFDVIPSAVSSASTYTVPDDSIYFLFSRSGVKPLSKGQSIFLTPHSEIIRYNFGYTTGHIYPRQQKELTGELLLYDILAHCKRTEAYDRNIFSSNLLSNTACQYLKQCEDSGLINSVAKRYIEGERL
ncbi:MAG: hypothetical protein M0021_16725 [Clostridia bacterium]|nr:hypothetical protein [Clostridia bacterium]